MFGTSCWSTVLHGIILQSVLLNIDFQNGISMGFWWFPFVQIFSQKDLLEQIFYIDTKLSRILKSNRRQKIVAKKYERIYTATQFKVHYKWNKLDRMLSEFINDENFNVELVTASNHRKMKRKTKSWVT